MLEKLKTLKEKINTRIELYRESKFEVYPYIYKGINVKKIGIEACKEWFEFAYCDECGGDWYDHMGILLRINEEYKPKDPRHYSWYWKCV